MYEIVTASQAILSTLKTIKVIRDQNIEMQTIDLKEANLELRRNILSIEENLIEVQEQLQAVARSQELDEKYEFSQEEGVYRAKNPEVDGYYAFCLPCYHERREAIPMSQTDPLEKEKCDCHVCGYSIRSKNANERLRNSYMNDRHNLSAFM